MICYKCNAEIPDDSKVCPMCGVPVEYPQQEEPAAEVEQKGVLKKLNIPPVAKKLLCIGLPVIAVCVALVLLVTSNWRAIKGFAVKTFGDDNDYLRYVEAEQFGDYADTVTNVYGRFMDTFEKRDNISVKGSVEVEIGEKAKDLIADYAAIDVEYYEWLEKANIDYVTNIKDGRYQIEMSAGLNGKDIISGNVVMDEDGNVYLQVPELNKQYIFGEADETGAGSAVTGMESMNEIDFGKYLPDADQVNKLLKRYIKLVTETIDDVESEKVTLEVGGIENDYTALYVTIDEELMYKMALAALENVEDDKDIENIVGDIVELMDELGMGKVEADEIYDQLVDYSSKGADMIQDMLDSLEGDGEVYCVLVDYVDGGSNIIGRAIQMPMGEDGELVTTFEYYEVTRGGKYGMYLVAGSDGREVVMEGTGKKSGAKITITEGSVTMAMGEETMELITFTTKNLNEDDLADGYFNGSATIGLGKDFAKFYLGGNVPDSALALLDIQVKIEGKGNDAKTGDFTLSLISGEDMLVSFRVTGKQGGGSGIKVPDEDDCAWATDENDMGDWLDAIDTDKVIKNLEKAGVPDDIIEALEGAVEGGFDFGGAQKVPAVNTPNYGDVIYGGY